MRILIAVEATTYFGDPAIIAKVSRGLGEAMVGIEIDTLSEKQAKYLASWDEGT